jgi:23S rRNA G2445 N2-methylase RlmL
MVKSNYKIKFLKGTQEFVLREILEKHPDVKILKKSSKEVVVEKDCKIESFRNLYSPIQIEDSNGKILNLSKREWRKSFVSAGINPSLAYILCMIAEINSNDILLDPFCGSSVIPITAVKYFNAKRVICSDISGRAVEVSKENFQIAEIEEDRYMLFRSDIKDIYLNKRNVDKIVSNLPFGIRVGSHDENVSAYINLELLAKRLLRKKGVLVLLTQEKKLLREVFKKEDWNVKGVLRVDQGGLLPEVFVVKRRNISN